jgi:hypothetical protein
MPQGSSWLEDSEALAAERLNGKRKIEPIPTCGGPRAGSNDEMIAGDITLRCGDTSGPIPLAKYPCDLPMSQEGCPQVRCRAGIGAHKMGGIELRLIWIVNRRGDMRSQEWLSLVQFITDEQFQLKATLPPQLDPRA